jgi:hypothetical protein
MFGSHQLCLIGPEIPGAVGAILLKLALRKWNSGEVVACLAAPEFLVWSK